MIVYAVFNLYGVTVKVGDQLRRIKNLLSIVFLAVEFNVLNAVNGKSVTVALDDFQALLHKALRVVQEILRSAASFDDLRNCCLLNQRFFADDTEDIRQGRIGVFQIFRAKFGFSVGNAGVLNINGRRLLNQSCLRDMRHIGKVFNAILNQLVRVDLHTVSGLLLDLPPKLHKLRGEHNLFVEPHNDFLGIIADRNTCVRLINDAL